MSNVTPAKRKEHMSIGDFLHKNHKTMIGVLAGIGFVTVVGLALAVLANFLERVDVWMRCGG